MDTEELAKLPDNERREWLTMLSISWFRELPELVQQAAIHRPPFYLYKLRSTGHLVSIKKYDQNKTNDEDIKIVVVVSPDFNKEFVFERELWGVPAEELEKIKLLSVAKMEKLLSSARGLPWMKRLINTRSREDVLRGNNPLN